MLKWTIPGAIWLSLAILPILFFYFLRIRFRSQPVSSIYLWSRLQNVTTGGSKLQRKSILLLLLQIAMALAAVAAVAQPFLFNRRAVAPGTVYLIDVSASMNAVESSSGVRQTRLEMARELLAAAIRNLKPKTNCMVFLCDTEAKPLNGPTDDHERVITSLNRIKTRNAGFNETEVSNQLQAWLGTQQRPWQACLISDGGLDLGGQRLANVFGGRLEPIIVGNERRNLGISGLRLAGSEASFLVNNGWPHDREIQVGLIDQDRTLARTALNVPPGLSKHALQLNGAVKPGIYKLQLEQNNDALIADDVSYLAVNEPRRFRVLKIGPANPFLQSFLGHPLIEMESIPNFPKELAGYWDLIIADRVSVPPDLKANLLAFEQIPPKAPVSFGRNVNGGFEQVGASHPLLRFVKWENIQVVNGYGFKVNPELPVLAEVAGEPIITAWEEDGWRKIVCGFSLYSSNIGLSGAFPIFIQNVLQWLAPQGANQLAYNLTVGEPVVFGESPRWRIINGKDFNFDRRGPLIQIKALKTGAFQWQTDSKQGFLAVNPPFGESDLTPRPLQIKQTAAVLAAEVATEQIGLTQWPLLILLGCLLLEWLIWRGGWRLGKERS